MTFVIPDQPIGKGRPRVVNGHAYTPERTRTHEDKIALLARNAMMLAGAEPFAGPVSISIWFYLPNHQHEADLDNYIKLVLDGCNGVIYADDRQVVVIHAWKRFDKKNPRTEIEILSVVP
jgi:Holliday junction resolvase RusA-like endonuclease